MGIKEYIFSKIIELPNFINYRLMQINKYPQIIFGKQYIKYKSNIQNSTTEENEFKLLKLINYSLKHVKYYKDKYPLITINSIEEFQNKIDFIDKDIVMNDTSLFLSDELDMNKFIKGTTGGTSGKPLQLIIPKNRHIVELGTVHNYWGQYGYDFSPRAVLRNKKIDNKPFIINPITKEVIFDGFNLTDKNFEIIYKTMKKYKIKFLQCYPSSGYLFAKYLKNNKLDVSFIKSFFVSSENLLDYQKDFIQSLGIELFSLYGHSEKLVIAGTCSYSGYYHFESSYGYMELIDSNNNLITDEGILGEIVGTSFNNFGMPLIRYKTGDYAEYIDIECECGFKGKTVKTILGRWNGDKVYNKDGTFVTTTALNLHNELYSVIDGIQYIQKQKGELIINIIEGPNFTKKDENNIIKHFKNKLASDCIITLHRVKTLLKQKNGKFLLLISGVKHD
jgi:phenylacetate-CoA ligase